MKEMGKRYELSEGEKQELRSLRSRNKDKNVERRIRALLLYAEGEKCREIAIITGYAKTYIWELVAKYREHGFSVIGGGNYGGNHRNMSKAEEEALLEPFRKAAEAGQVVEISDIKRAYEEKIGRTLEKSHSQIYNVLHRHGWRKIMPRSKHPKKASDEEIEASKKLTKECKG
jgi:transposase